MKGNKLKVFTFFDEKEGGSRYIRAFLPLKDLEQKGVIDLVVHPSSQSLEHSILEDVDIVYHTWISNIPITTWSQLVALYKFKFVLDLDDTIQNSSVIKDVDIWVNNVLFADYVCISNPNLGHEVSTLNDKIYYIGNSIPLGQGQYEVKKNTPGDPFRVGFIGSGSHIYNWLSIKNVINRIAKNKELVEKCEFVIAGYKKGDAGWEALVNFLKKKKHLKLKLIEFMPLNSFMDSYNEFDAILAPLVENPVNICRSGLKVIESSCKGVPLVGSSLYKNKEFNEVIVAETPKEYEEAILNLLNFEAYDEVVTKIVNTNLSNNNWEGRIELYKELLFLVDSQEEESLPIDVEIHSVYYDSNSQVCEYTPYLNVDKVTPWRFEYTAIQNIVPNCTKDYVGVFSWKFPFKTGLYKKVLLNGLKQLNYKDFDIINFSPKFWMNTEEFLKFSYEQHPKLEELLSKVLDKLGYDKGEYYSTPFYSNFFIAKTEVYKTYLNEVINPAIEYMENEIWEEVNVDAEYKSGLSPEKLKEFTGMEYYNYVTFICERLLPFFIHKKGLKVRDIFNVEKF